MTLLKDIFHTITHPSLPATGEKISFSMKLFCVLRIWIFQFGLAVILGIVVSLFASAINYNMDDNLVNQMIDKLPILTILFLTVIYAPLSEELTFRLFLKYSPLRFGISLSFIVLFILSILEQFHVYTITFIRLYLGLTDPLLFSIAYILIGVVIGLVIGVIIKAFSSQSFMERVFKKIFPILFFFSAIGFGLMHITNFPGFEKIWYYAPILVLPQLAIGFLLAYARIKYGFKWNVLLHALHNGTTLIPTVLIRLGSSDLKAFTEDKFDFQNLNSTDLVIILSIIFFYIFMVIVFIIVVVQLILESIKNQPTIAHQ